MTARHGLVGAIMSVTLVLLTTVNTVGSPSTLSISPLTAIAPGLGGTVELAWHDHATRASFYAVGRPWVFYGVQGAHGLNLFYSTFDGKHWTRHDTTIATQGNDYGQPINAETNGTYVFVTTGEGRDQGCSSFLCLVLHYGRLNADGTITWRSGPSGPTAVREITRLCGACPVFSSIKISTENTLFVSYSNLSATYVSWTRDYNSWNTLKLDSLSEETALARLSSGKMYVAFGGGNNRGGGSNTTIYGRLWDGEGWGDTEVITRSHVAWRGNFGVYPTPLFLFAHESTISIFYQGCSACREDDYSIEEAARNASMTAWTSPSTAFNNTLPSDLLPYGQCTGNPLDVDLWTITEDKSSSSSFFLTTYLSPRVSPPSEQCSPPGSRITVYSSTGTRFQHETGLATSSLPSARSGVDFGAIISDPETIVIAGRSSFNVYVKDSPCIRACPQVQASTITFTSQ